METSVSGFDMITDSLHLTLLKIHPLMWSKTCTVKNSFVLLHMKCFYRRAQKTPVTGVHCLLLYHCRTQEDGMTQIFTVWIPSILLVHHDCDITLLSCIDNPTDLLMLRAARNGEGGLWVEPEEQRMPSHHPHMWSLVGRLFILI